MASARRRCFSLVSRSNRSAHTLQRTSLRVRPMPAARSRAKRQALFEKDVGSVSGQSWQRIPVSCGLAPRRIVGCARGLSGPGGSASSENASLLYGNSSLVTSPQRGHSGRSRPPSPSPGSISSHQEHGQRSLGAALAEPRLPLPASHCGWTEGTASAEVIFIVFNASLISRRFSSDGFSAHSLSSAGVGAAFGTLRAARGRVDGCALDT